MGKPNRKLIDARLLEATRRRPPAKHRKRAGRVKDPQLRLKQTRRLVRNVALAIVFWFALLGLCLFAYEHYFKFFSYPWNLGGPITPRG